MGPRGNPVASRLVKNADVILAIGTRLGFNSTFYSYENINKNMKIVLDEVKKNENFLFARIDYKKNRPQIDIKIDKDKVSDLGISNLVEFLGNTNQVEKNLCHSDLFLLPSSTESFGLAALEAMASKVAVISSNAGGLPEINIDGKTGYVCDFNDINSMINKGISILNDKKTLELFKENAFNKARDYDIKKIVPLYEKTYSEAVKITK